jgi:hypothetical protein
MDRRKSLKVIALGTVSTSLLLQACQSPDKKNNGKQSIENQPGATTIDRMEEEAIEDKRLASETFFNTHEMATIAVLCDIIIPADEISGSATEAKVPDFIEFMVKDKPDLQLPLRGGLKWLDMHMLKLHEKTFKDCSTEQQLAVVDQIAYPEKAKPEMKQGVTFFSRMRNLTASGFYTSKIGIEDMGYMGNKANQWNGVPDDVLKQYGLAYSEKELKECISFS